MLHAAHAGKLRNRADSAAYAGGICIASILPTYRYLLYLTYLTLDSSLLKTLFGPNGPVGVLGSAISQGKITIIPVSV